LKPNSNPHPIYSRLASEIQLDDTTSQFHLLPQRLWESSFRKTNNPYYRSFDYYTLIISLLCIEYWFEAVFGNYLFKAIVFDGLFIPEEQSNVYSDIKAIVASGIEPSFEDIISLLKKYTLRCNALDESRRRISELENIVL